MKSRFNMTCSANSLLASLLIITGCANYVQDLSIDPCLSGPEGNNFSKAAEIKSVMHEIVNSGVPGCAVAVYSEEGWFTASAGLAKIESNTAMEVCHLQYVQSVSKTYMAVGILKLYEQGKINLDIPITTYLPARFSKYISSPERITVRMLLNHTSGIPEYNMQPAYVSKLLQEPGHVFSSEDYLRFIEGKPLDFEPGSRFGYRNTNYVLLALIADALTGNHAKLLESVIFQPLQLSNTYYRHDAGYLNYPNLVNTYWDRYSDGVVENVSQMQRTNVASLVGDDGIVTTPEEAVKFLKGLMEGQLLNSETMKQMTVWVKDSKGVERYGLGLDYAKFQNEVAYGHSGGGLGAGCQLYYFPDKKLYVFIGINLGTITEGPIHKRVAPLLDRFYELLLK